jgi:hypothetical protein
MAKNPYEIRLDILRMAQDMLETDRNIQNDRFHQKLDVMRSVKGADTSELTSFIDKETPPMYTENDILTKSQALYNFVSEDKK